MQSIVDFVLSFPGYVTAALLTLICATGPLLVQDTKERLKYKDTDCTDDTIYLQSALASLFFAAIWPLTIGFFILVGILKGLTATMKTVVKLSSKE